MTFVAGTDVTFHITQKAITITINGSGDTQTYTGSELTSETTVTPSCSDSLFDAEKFSYTGATTITKTNVGEYSEAIDTTKAAYADNNLDVTFVAGTPVTFKISSRTVTVSVEDKTTEYNGSTQYGNSEYAFENVVTGQTATITYIPSSGILASETPYDNGAYTANTFKVEDGDGNDVTSNYTLGMQTAGKLTITDRTKKYEITVVADSTTATYDGNTHSATGFKTLEFEVEGNTYTVSGLMTSNPSGKDVCDKTNAISGTAVVKDAAGNNVTAQFDITKTNGSLTINPARITIKAEDKTKVYDNNVETDPELTAEVTGVPEKGDTPVYSLSRVEGQNAGDYAITVSAPANDNPNYTISVEDGTFTITPLAVTVTITGNTNGADEPIIYNGEEQHIEGYEFNSSSDLYTENDFTFNGDAIASGKDAGEYPMNLTTDRFTNNNDNFTVTFNVTDGKLTINRAPLTITADDKTKVSGNPEPEYTYTVDGLLGDDTLSDDFAVTYTREQNEAVGTYPITPAGPATDGNYAITYMPGTLTIVGRGGGGTVTPEEPAEHTVSYSFTGDVPDGVSAPGSQTYKVGDTVRVAGSPAAPEGYTFHGWSRNGSFEMPDNDVTITGRWTKDEVVEPDPEPTPDPDPIDEPDDPTNPPVNPDAGLEEEEEIDEDAAPLAPFAPYAPATEEPAEPEEEIEENETPEGTFTPNETEVAEITPIAPIEPAAPAAGGGWALINLILGAVAAISAIFALTAKKDEEDEDGQSEEDEDKAKKHRLAKAGAAAVAVAAIVTFLLTEDMSQKMVMVDKWTLLMGLYAIGDGLFTYNARKGKDEEEEKANA